GTGQAAPWVPIGSVAILTACFNPERKAGERETRIPSEIFPRTSVGQAGVPIDGRCQLIVSTTRPPAPSTRKDRGAAGPVRIRQPFLARFSPSVASPRAKPWLTRWKLLRAAQAAQSPRASCG